MSEPRKSSIVQRLSRFSSVILGTGAVTSLFVFGLLVNRYGITPHYFVFVGASILLVWGLRLPESIRINVVLCSISVILALYTAEFLLAHAKPAIKAMGPQAWLSFPQDANAKVAAERMRALDQTQDRFDTRTRLEVVLDMRRKGINAYPDVFPMVLFTPSSAESIRSIFTEGQEEFLPLAGMATSTTVFCNESGEYVVYESDEHGFHNPKGIWSHKPVDLVALGDSYTHGVCVPSGKGFVAVLRSQYPNTINLGINGHGPLTSLATLKEYGSFLKPKLALWFYYEGNDLRDLDGWEKNSPLLMRYVTSSFSQHLIDRQDGIDRSLKDYLDREMEKATAGPSIEKIVKLQHVRHAIQSFYDRRPSEEGLPAELVDYLRRTGAPANPADLKLFERVLAEAKNTVNLWGGRLVFVYLPTWERYRFPELASKDRDKVLLVAKMLDLEVIDLHEIFSAHPDPLSLFPFRRYAHYNEAGHRLVGEEVLRRLIK